jgi:hypothetical protein
MAPEAVGAAGAGVACALRCGACGVQGEFEGNCLLRCEQCGLRVHQRCAGAYASRTLCRRCWAEDEGVCEPVALPERRCQLCPNLGGPQVELEGSEFRLWAHVLCGAWVPEVWFEDELAAHPLCGVRESKVLVDRFKLRCSVCKRRGAGACIQCCSGRCTVAAHATCALAAGLLMRADVAEGKLVLEFYCKSHAPEAPVNPPSSLAELGMCAPPPDSERSLLEELRALSGAAPEQQHAQQVHQQVHQQPARRRGGRPPKRALSDNDDDDEFKPPGAASSSSKRRSRRSEGPRPRYDESALDEGEEAAAAEEEQDNDEDGNNDEDESGIFNYEGGGNSEERRRRRRGRAPRAAPAPLHRTGSHVSHGTQGSQGSHLTQSSTVSPLSGPVTQQPFREIRQAVQHVSREYFGKVTMGQVKEALSAATRWGRLPGYASAEPAGFPQDLKGLSVSSDFGAVKVDPDAFNWLFSEGGHEVRLAPGRAPLLARAGWRHVRGGATQFDTAQRWAFGLQALSLGEAPGAERSSAPPPAALVWNLVSLKASVLSDSARLLVYVPVLEGEGPEAAALLVAALAARLREHGARVLSVAGIEPPGGAAWDPASLVLFLRVPFEWWQAVRRLLGDAVCFRLLGDAVCFRVRAESPGQQLSHVTLCLRLGDVSWADVERGATARRSLQLRLRLTNFDGFQPVAGEGEGVGGVVGAGRADLGGPSLRAPVCFGSGHLTAAEWAGSAPALDSAPVGQGQGQGQGQEPTPTQTPTPTQQQQPPQQPQQPLDLAALDVERVATELAACVWRNQLLVAGLLARAERVTRLEHQRSGHGERVEREYWQRVGKRDEEQKAREEHDLNAHCTVCHGGDSAFGNLIVICEDCEQGFHERCHATKIDLQAPAWFCHNCAGRGARKQPREANTQPGTNLASRPDTKLLPPPPPPPLLDYHVQQQQQQQQILLGQQEQRQRQHQHQQQQQQQQHEPVFGQRRHRVAARSPDSHAASPASSATSLTSPDSVAAQSDEMANKTREHFARAIVSPTPPAAPAPGPGGLSILMLAAQSSLVRASLADSF